MTPPDGGRTRQHRLLDLLVDDACAERLDEDADRVGLADRVGDLDLAARRQASSHDVLGHPPHGVRRGPVHLGRILAGEGAATVAGHAAVGVDDDLAASETGVAHRATDDEVAGRVDQRAIVAGVEVDGVEDRVDDVAADVRVSMLSRLTWALCCVDSTTVSIFTGIVLVIGDGDLRLPSGRRQGTVPSCGPRSGSASRCASEIGSGITRRVVAGVPEHQALVAGALPVERVGTALGALPKASSTPWASPERLRGREMPHDAPSKP